MKDDGYCGMNKLKSGQARIAQFLTVDELERARQIWKTSLVGEFPRRCEAEIILPVMDRINKQLGQENDSLFLAYMVESAISMEL